MSTEQFQRGVLVNGAVTDGHLVVWDGSVGEFVAAPLKVKDGGPVGGGGGGTPGGSSGDLQYNNAGAFGGITPAAGVVTFLETPTSANLKAALTDETGSGAAVFATSPALVTPDLGVPSAIDLTNATNVPSQAGRLLGVRRITATGAYTYTPTAGTNAIIIELQGAGGGGSGVASAAASQVNIGGGGGGGAWLRKRLTSNFSGATGSVGAKGTGGAAGNNNGNAGGNTTFIDTAGSPTTYTANGGAGN